MEAMAERVIMTVFVVVAHLVNEGTLWGLNCLINDTNFLTERWSRIGAVYALCWIDGFVYTNFFPIARFRLGIYGPWRIDGGIDTVFLAISRFRLGIDSIWGINGCIDASFLTISWFRLGIDGVWRIDGCIDTDFLAIGWLETRPIVSFGNVNRRVETMVTTARFFYLDTRVGIFFAA